MIKTFDARRLESSIVVEPKAKINWLFTQSYKSHSHINSWTQYKLNIIAPISIIQLDIVNSEVEIVVMYNVDNSATVSLWNTKTFK